jgi:hypothetical protein
LVTLGRKVLDLGILMGSLLYLSIDIFSFAVVLPPKSGSKEQIA